VPPEPLGSLSQPLGHGLIGEDDGRAQLDAGKVQPATFPAVEATKQRADALVVKMTLIPFILHPPRERTWYIPRWLDRLLPNVTIEPPHDGEAPEPGRLPKPEPREA
jgi:hypothetical protein